MFCRIGCVLILLCGVLRPLSSAELTETAIAGFESNYSMIETVQAQYDEKNSGNVGSRFDVTVYLKGPTVRVDREEKASEQREVFLFKGNVWTQYMRATENSAGKKGIAWVRNPSQMPRLFPLDVRQEVCQSLEQDYVATIRDLVGRKERWVDDVTIEITGKAQADGKLRTHVLCDSSKSFLPVRMYTQWADGSGIVQRVDIQYVSVLDGAAWWPHEISRSFFKKGETDLDSTASSSTVTKTLKGKLVVNEPIDDAVFSTAFLEPGTEIRDSIIGESRFVVEANKLPGILGWLCVTAVTIGGCFLVLKRRSHKFG